MRKTKNDKRKTSLHPKFPIEMTIEQKDFTRGSANYMLIDP